MKKNKINDKKVKKPTEIEIVKSLQKNKYYNIITINKKLIQKFLSSKKLQKF